MLVGYSTNIKEKQMIQFGNKLGSWIYEKTGLKLRKECITSINNHSIELVAILKKNPEWLAEKFVEMFSDKEKNYEEKIISIINSFTNKL